MAVRQKLLPFEGGGRGRRGERNSPERSTVQQAMAARKEAETTSSPLLEEIVREGTLARAWKAVRANKGGAGVDGRDLSAFGDWWREHRPRVIAELRAGTYRPQPVRRSEIPKPSGGVRTLGIPTVLDRVVQHAIVKVLTPILDPGFSEHSYGFRPGRSAHQAVLKAREHVACGYRWVVDVDLESFFDRVHHDVLMERLSRKVNDKPLLRLIRRYLTAGVMEGGIVSPRTAGTPQGGPLSPLLSNVLLHEWDVELERRGHRFVRYADDCNVYVRSQRAGERVLASCRHFLERRLRLRVNATKSAVARPWRRSFLGYSVTTHHEPRLRLGNATVARLRERLRALTRRTRGRSIERIVAELNAYLRGWLGYYRRIETPSVLVKLQSWIHRKLRCYRIKQLGRSSQLYRELKRAGVRDIAWTATTSRGPWRLSRNHQIHQAFGARYFATLGLLQLPERWRTLASTT